MPMFTTAMASKKHLLTTAACFRFPFTGTAQDSFLALEICLTLKRPATTEMTMVLSSYLLLLRSTKCPHLIELTLFQRAVRSMFLTARASAMRRLRNCSSASSRLSLKRSGTHHSPATLLDVHLYRSALLRPQALVLQLGSDSLFADR